MNGKSVLGMLFANIHEEALDTLTAMRTMGSVLSLSFNRLSAFKPCRKRGYKNRCCNKLKLPFSYGPYRNR